MLIMWIQQYSLKKKNNCFLKQLGFMIHCLADYCSKAHTVLIQEKPKRIHGHQVMHNTELRIHTGQTRKNIKVIGCTFILQMKSCNCSKLFFILLLFRHDHGLSCSWLKKTTRFHFKVFLSRILYNLVLPHTSAVSFPVHLVIPMQSLVILVSLQGLS